MKKNIHIMKVLLTLALALTMLFTTQSTFAASQSEYTYTVTLYAGNQGAFVDASAVSTAGTSGTVSYTDGKITISGLKKNDVLSMDAQISGAVQLGDNSRYYVKGVRESGLDNANASNSAFKVTGDADYVVAYGIAGDLVAYTVNFQDAAGNTLAPSRTYYGNVGDKPVVGFLYIEGYQPQAYNVTKTLSSNEADNVFVFTYTPGGGTATVPPDNATPGAGEAGTIPDAGAATPGAGTTPGAGVTPEAGADAPAADIADPEVPLDAPEETDDQDIPDEEVPLANHDDDGTAKVTRENSVLPIAAGIGIAVLAIAAIIFLIVLMNKRRKTATAVHDQNPEDQKK